MNGILINTQMTLIFRVLKNVLSLGWSFGMFFAQDYILFHGPPLPKILVCISH